MTPAHLLEASQWDTFWVPRDVTVTARPELLLLGCDRPMAYLNVVLRARGPVAARLAEVLELQGWRHTRWMVTDTSDPAPVERGLAKAGWTPGGLHEVRSLRVSDWSRAPAVAAVPVDDLRRLQDCIDVSNAAFGSHHKPDPDDLAEELAACTAGARVHRFVAYVDGRPAASGGLTAFPHLGFGLLWAGATHPDLRGRGAYTAVLHARIERARALGLARVGLYALETTSAPIVARMGFSHGGTMRFWERPKE